METNGKNIVERCKKYFGIKELVSRTVYEKHGEKAWIFLDARLLETLLVLREDVLKVPLVINDWSFGGKNQQRGLRENISQIVSAKTKKGELYLSSHTMGRAFDCVSAKMSAVEMRRLIVEKAYKLPYPIRVESGSSAPTWLHFDVSVPHDSKYKITTFS